MNAAMLAIVVMKRFLPQPQNSLSHSKPRNGGCE
jgi:hypothetical protein